MVLRQVDLHRRDSPTACCLRVGHHGRHSRPGTKALTPEVLQQVLARPHWAGRLNARDLDTLPIWEDVNSDDDC